MKEKVIFEILTTADMLAALEKPAIKSMDFVSYDYTLDYILLFGLIFTQFKACVTINRCDNETYSMMLLFFLKKNRYLSRFEGSSLWTD